MGEAGFWDNPEAAQKVIQQLKPLNGLIKPFEEIEVAIADLEVMAELAGEDAELASEMPDALEKLEKKFEDFELRTMLSGAQDASNAFLRIQSGAGGTDACDWVAMLMRMYIRWAERNGFTVTIEDEEPNEEAGYSSVDLKVSGDYAYGYLQGENGVHRLVRISPFGSGDTRQTSFAAVEVLPEVDDTIEIEVREVDLIMQTFCSGGPGGQHQNKTQSGVRLIHTPTNVRAESRTERSQHKNKDNAMKLLKARLYAIEQAKLTGDQQNRYNEKGEVAFGSQIRNYVLQPYTLVKDVRTAVETGQVQAVLDGEINAFLEGYLRFKAQRDSRKTAV